MERMYHSSFNYPPAKKHLDSFNFEAITNKVAIQNYYEFILEISVCSRV
jgi:hypothetical protein